MTVSKSIRKREIEDWLDEEEEKDQLLDESKPRKKAAKRQVRRWSPEERIQLIDCIDKIIKEHLSTAIREYPLIVPRTTTGCHRHWEAIRNQILRTIRTGDSFQDDGPKIKVKKSE